MVGEPCVRLGGHDEIACFGAVEIRFLLCLNDIDTVQLREELLDGVQIIFILNINMRDLMIAHSECAAVVEVWIGETAGNCSRGEVSSFFQFTIRIDNCRGGGDGVVAPNDDIVVWPEGFQNLLERFRQKIDFWGDVCIVVWPVFL